MVILKQFYEIWNTWSDISRFITGYKKNGTDTFYNVLILIEGFNLAGM